VLLEDAVVDDEGEAVRVAEALDDGVTVGV